MKIHNNKRGFTLVEVMVTAGLIGGLSVVMMNLVTNIQKNTKKMNQDFEILSIHQSITKTLRDKSHCRATFNIDHVTSGLVNKDPVPFGGKQLIEADGGTLEQIIRMADNKYEQALQPQYEINQTIGAQTGGAITITGMEMVNYRTTNPPPVRDPSQDSTMTANIEMGEVDLKITYNRLTQDQIALAAGDASVERNIVHSKSFGGVTLAKTIPMNVFLNASGEIIDCYTDEVQQVEAACSSLNGVLQGTSCRNIQIDHTLAGIPAGADSNPAITSRGTLKVENAGAGATLGHRGDLEVEGNAGIGAEPLKNGTSGILTVGNSVTVGASPSPVATTAGQVWVQGSVAIGTASEAVNPGLGVGTLPTGAGNIDASANLRINGSSALVGDTTVGNDSNNTWLRIADYKSGSANNSISVKGNIQTDYNYNSSGAFSSDRHFVTKGWVINHVGQTLSPTPAVGALVSYIDNLNISQGFEAIKAAICGSTYINGVQQPANCNFDNVGGSITSMTYDTSNGQLTVTEDYPTVSRTVTIRNCSFNGVCDNIYATNNATIGGSLTVGGNATITGATTSSRFCIAGNCRTTFSTQACPAGRVVVSIGRGGTVGCAPDLR